MVKKKDVAPVWEDLEALEPDCDGKFTGFQPGDPSVDFAHDDDGEPVYLDSTYVIKCGQLLTFTTYDPHFHCHLEIARVTVNENGSYTFRDYFQTPHIVQRGGVVPFAPRNSNGYGYKFLQLHVNEDGSATVPGPVVEGMKFSAQISNNE